MPLNLPKCGISGLRSTKAGILGALDRDGDGNPLNDLGGIAGSLFGKK